MAVDDSWWGGVVDGVSGAVDSMFGDGTNVDNYGTDTYDADYGGSAISESYGGDYLADALDTDDSMWDDTWNSVFDTASSIGSGIADFAGTKGGQQAIAGAVSVLGQYLMGDSKTGARPPSLSYGGGGGSAGGSGNVTQGRTTSNLASIMVK